MRTAVLLSVVVTALALAGSASAGCFATASSTSPGETHIPEHLKRSSLRPSNQ